jgi:outer membrane protein OmpA-like peptidoglycan-associated protein
VAKTGDLVRAVFDAHLGYDLNGGGFGIGPFVGYEQVLQGDQSLRPDDAHLVLFGVHAVLGTKTKTVEVPSDRDEDGILDNVDKCPDDPEDKDGFEDEDGCPDRDNDKDGILDANDACPNEAGPATQDPKTNGCPVRDRDHDGIPDNVDKCPDEPEDKDGFEDEDGCPDPDNDKDGIPDVTDKCPNEPETMNGYADEDGCPDEAQVRVVGDKILLDDRVHFNTNMSIVLGVSYPLLQRVGRLINAHPEYTHVEVAGYADERGPEAFNQKLSEARAKAVMDILIRYGHVDAQRLSAVGYGTANPRIAESNEKAWRENRRTEFTITRENKQTTYTDFPGANVIDRPAGSGQSQTPAAGQTPAKNLTPSQTPAKDQTPAQTPAKNQTPAPGGTP